MRLPAVVARGSVVARGESGCFVMARRRMLLPSPFTHPICMSVDWTALEKLKNERMATMAPWKTFLDVHQFDKPVTLGEASARLQRNVQAFAMNYAAITLFFFIYVLLTHWLLFLILGIVLAGFGVLLTSMPREEAVFLPRPLDSVRVNRHQSLIAWSIVSLILIVGSSAGSALFWVVGISAMTVGLHAIFHQNLSATAGESGSV